MVPRKQIRDGGQALKEIMQEFLADLAESTVEQIKKNLNNATPAERINSIKDVYPVGVQAYKDVVLTALAVIAEDAISAAKKSVPKAKNVELSAGEESIKLDEFDDLPAALKKKLKLQMELLVGTQINDLIKNIFFQFNSSLDSTDSTQTIIDDLYDSADDYIRGAALTAGATTTAAQVVNTARSAFFLNDDVLQEVEAFEFVNGDPVSEICQDLAGTVFAKDDPGLNRYMPPLHFNCKSSIEPILVGNLGNRDIEKLKPSTQKIEETIQFQED